MATEQKPERTADQRLGELIEDVAHFLKRVEDMRKLDGGAWTWFELGKAVAELRRDLARSEV